MRYDPDCLQGCKVDSNYSEYTKLGLELGKMEGCCAFTAVLSSFTEESYQNRAQNNFGVTPKGYHDYWADKYVPPTSPEEVQAAIEKLMWHDLSCMCKASETKGTFVYTTDKEPEMRDLIGMCPYAELHDEVVTGHSGPKYLVQCWYFRIHKPQEVN
jgi:hypothetical protein